MENTAFNFEYKPRTGSEAMCEALLDEGVEYLFGYPGGAIMPFYHALPDYPLKHILTRHEQAAAFMAATYGRLTGRPGVCISTLGPGALNLATGAAYAHLGAMPMVLITGQKAIRSSQQARFQIVDMVAIMKPLTKFSRQIVSVSSIPAIVRDAFRTATEERPGPVHLELPEDIAGEEGPAVPLVPAHPVELPVAHPAALDRAADMIRRAHRPLVMLGAAASRPRLGAMLSDFLARTQLPFFTTQMGKGVVADFFPQVAMKGYQLVASSIVQSGIDTMFGLAGDANLYMIDELIRALGAKSVEQVIDAKGELGSFRTLQKQAAWQGRPTEEQLRRFMGSGGRRKIRYARLLVDAIDLARVPRPLDRVLTHV